MPFTISRIGFIWFWDACGVARGFALSKDAAKAKARLAAGGIVDAYLSKTS